VSAGLISLPRFAQQPFLNHWFGQRRCEAGERSVGFGCLRGSGCVEGGQTEAAHGSQQPGEIAVLPAVAELGCGTID
jgi:hypothetical protein